MSIIALYLFIALLLFAFLAIACVPVFVYTRKTLFDRSQRDIWIFVGAVGLVPIAAIVLYLKWGASTQLAESYAMSRAIASISTKSDKVDQVGLVIQRFLSYLAAHPEDAKGWYLLGRLYLDQGNLVKAADAFKHSLKHDPKNTEVMAQYAQTLYFLNHQQLTDQSLHLVQIVLSQDPKNSVVLNLLAMDAFSHHRYALAMTYWQRLQSQYSQNTPEFNTLTTAIDICKKRENSLQS